MTDLLLQAVSLWWLDVALKSSLLLAVTLLIALLLRRTSAATQHRVWVLGFAACLLVPVISLAVPGWRLPDVIRSWLVNVPTSAAENASPSFAGHPEETFSLTSDFSLSNDWPLRTDSGVAQSLSHEDERSLSPDLPVTTSDDVRDAAGTTPLTASRSGVATLSNVSWVAVGLAIWTVGVALCLLQTLWQCISFSRVMRRCVEVSQPEWLRLRDDAASAIGPSRMVRLFHCEEARTPMVVGVWRPMILLPPDTENWSDAHRRSVLLHELGHIQRHDVATQSLAGFVCALHWFNPLAWYGLAQMRKLRELACDDLVLACGQPPADYADVLLDVARAYRHHSLAMAVGMARSSNVEHRILAILDRARNHMTLTPRTARLSLLTATALVLLIGSMRLETRANPPAETTTDETATQLSQATDDTTPEQPEAAPADEPSQPTDGLRNMLIRITDETGAPLKGADLHLSIWDVEGHKTPKVARDYVTNEFGLADIIIPEKLRILRLWPRKAGYVPQFVNFGEGTHDEGKLIPQVYDFQMEKGMEIGGIIVDEDGQPIQGVKVEVKVDVDEPKWGVNPPSMISTWLTDDDYIDGIPISDEKGRWSIHNAPAPRNEIDFEFRLMLTHDDYISDTQYGQSQDQQNVTVSQLRASTAKLVMSRGIAVSGTVRDQEGQPVEKGLVIWHDRPYWSHGVHEAQIGVAGRYTTLRLLPGEYPFTIVAPGYQPTTRKVTVAENLAGVDFQLQPGKRLAIQFVDERGEPIPEVYVGVREWRGAESLYNHKHSSVPESGIPGRANEHGLYEWSWAPEDAVKFSFGVKGYEQMEIALVAKDEPHVVTLSPPLMATGRVTDTATGKPIESFQVVPIKEFRPKFMTTLFDDEKSGVNGQYEINFSDGTGGDDRFRIRIDADGYRSVISEKSYGNTDGRVTLDFALEPADSRKGLVLDPDGNPAAFASIVVASPSVFPTIYNSELDRGNREVRSDDDGRFELRATSEPIGMRVLHESGVAEIELLPDDEIGILRLQPWASISGQLIQDGQPIANEWIYFHRIVDRPLGEPRFQSQHSARTDDDGRFRFDDVPPVAGSVRALLSPWGDSQLTSSQSVAVDLLPGEERTVSLGGEGVRITGQVLSTGRDNTSLDKHWSLNYLIRRDQGIDVPDDLPLGFDPSGPVQTSWLIDPTFNRWVATRQNYFVKLTSEGKMTIHGVSPGVYDLVLRLYEQPAGCLVEAIGQRIVTIKVTEEDVATGNLDIGTIEVECRTGPRIGANMQAYKFTDVTGRQRTVQEMEGRFVVMHVWASWCGPCLEAMPEVRASVGDLAEQPVTFVGVSVDADRDRARTLVRDHEWDWAQNYLGEDSDMARQLAISSVPTYYLIGPDGTLIASSNQWPEIRERLELSLPSRD